ncbi:MAG: (d)CMP kinase [Anaerolineales bacterium]|nr:(d)CMP kinase [Anaerolineales bacterium]
MDNSGKCAGVVTVTLWFNSPRHIDQIRQSIEILRSLGIPKIFVVQDVKTKIPLDTFAGKDVEVVEADVFETCQKWYIGLSKAFKEGYGRAFVFPGDVEQYNGKDLLDEPTLRNTLISKMEKMLLDPSDLIIGDYSVPFRDENPKYQLSKRGAFELLKEFFPEESKKIIDQDICFPRSEFFIVSRKLFNSFFSKGYYAKWMPWEATLQLLVYASRNNYEVSRHDLGEIGDTAVKRGNDYEIANQLLRMQYTVFYEYLKYHGYENPSGHLPPDWLLHLKRSYNIISNFLAENFVVTIDGPIAAGKSTVARAIARKFGFLYVDGGTFFRALTLSAIDNKIDLDDEQKLVDLVEKVELRLEKSQENDRMVYKVFLDNNDVTTAIQSPQVSSEVPFVSRHERVRAQRKIWVRKLATDHNIIAEGRLLGSEVFPSANIKFALDATLEVRTLRRYLQLQERGEIFSQEEIKDMIVERDGRDRTTGKKDRLERQRDAIYLDSSSLTVDEVVHIFVENIQPAFELWKEQKSQQ